MFTPSSNHQYATSPWTEAYAMQFAGADNPAMPADFHSDEMQPTHDALAEVYNGELPPTPAGAFSLYILVHH